MNTANLIETLEDLLPHNPEFQTESGAPSNGVRADRGGQMLQTYQESRADLCPTDDPDTYADAITDILHRAHAEGFDTIDIVGRAIVNFREEANQVPS